MTCQETDAPAQSRERLRAPEFQPHPPTLLEDLGVPEHLIMDIALRHVYVNGLCSIKGLGEMMKLPLEVAESLFRRLLDQQQLEVRRTSGDDYVFSLSPGGKRLAIERGQHMRYAGPVPVSLRVWTEAVRRQSLQTIVTRERLREAFSDIVVSDKLLDALGPALISQGSIFIYGPSGTGKTTIAERLLNVCQEAIVVPWAVEVDGRIIILADPAIHKPVEIEGVYVDPRWCVCRRPYLAAGGELVTGMLDLQKDETTGVFVAPLQMKANNGILLIDDFGRQMISPRDLMNRWIVPLDRRVDFLSLGSGGKFDIPFELLVVFATNLEPHELGDEAFLRRIPNKILVGGVEPEAFDAIFHLSAAAAGMEIETGSEEHFRNLCLRHGPDLRPCYPRDICNAVRAIALYEGRKPAITAPDLDRAAAGYFVAESL